MKLTVVINGAGGVGKDTLCNIAAGQYRVRNVSSITPIKEIAAMCGWNGEKTDRARKFLSDLKLLTIAYNDYPSRWLDRQYRAFLDGDEEIMFVHIREPQEIAKFVRLTGGTAKTLLVRGGDRMAKKTGKYGNTADDLVENYPYDYYFMNDRSVAEAEGAFIALLHTMIRDAGE